MAYLYDVPEMNGSGVDEIVADVAQTVPIYTPMFLIFVFLFIFIIGYFKQERTGGSGDAAQWAAIASVSTMIIALLMTLRTGLIDLVTLVIVIVITIFCGAWFLLSRDRTA